MKTHNWLSPTLFGPPGPLLAGPLAPPALTRAGGSSGLHREGGSQRKWGEGLFSLHFAAHRRPGRGVLWALLVLVHSCVTGPTPTSKPGDRGKEQKQEAHRLLAGPRAPTSCPVSAAFTNPRFGLFGLVRVVFCPELPVVTTRRDDVLPAAWCRKLNPLLF